jgi:hypothetical protein
MLAMLFAEPMTEKRTEILRQLRNRHDAYYLLLDFHDRAMSENKLEQAAAFYRGMILIHAGDATVGTS